jgi:uncharacterized protein YndB with AHSA1/START domain
MSTPTAPYRYEITVEVPGTPEQVWAAIATANGISSWMMPTDLEERLGGPVEFHMGETSSKGEITGWDPPHRIEYVEPDWAALAGHGDAEVAPLITEFLVEAQSGGTCIVKVVSSSFGTGADWEQEFFDGLDINWTPMFDQLRLYLTHFPGQTVTPLEVDAQLPGSHTAVVAAMATDLGVEGIGSEVDTDRVTGRCDLHGAHYFALRISAPVTGYLSFWASQMGDDTVIAGVRGYLFDDGAAAYVEREQGTWQKWLEGMAVDAR